MKNLILIALCVSAAVAVVAQGPLLTNVVQSTMPKNVAQGTMPKNEAEARAKAERMRRRTGGFILDRRAAKGVFVFANVQKRVDVKELAVQISALERDCKITCKISSCDSVTQDSAVQKMKELDATAAVFLVDNDSPMSIMVAPEQKFAFVNVKTLTTDKPDAQTLAFRVRKEMTRAMAMVFGAGYSYRAEGVVSPAFSLTDLDALPLGTLPMGTSNMITLMAKEMGFVPFSLSLYSRALREGWAPAPKGEFQKALWEQYHAKPSEPMRVEFDKKKGE